MKSLCLILLFVIVSSPRRLSPAPTQRPNILLLTIDTIRADATGFGGCARPHHALLDSLAAGPWFFDNAHSTSSWTVPRRWPRVMTGLYPPSQRVVHGAIARGRAYYDQECSRRNCRSWRGVEERLGYRTYGYRLPTRSTWRRRWGTRAGFDRYKCVGSPMPTASIDRPRAGSRSSRTARDHGSCGCTITTRIIRITNDARGSVPSLPDVDARRCPHAPDGQGYRHPAPPAADRARRPLRRSGRAPVRRPSALHDEAIRHSSARCRVLSDAAIRWWPGDHGEEFLGHDNTGHCRNLHAETVPRASVRAPTRRRGQPATGRSSEPGVTCRPRSFAWRAGQWGDALTRAWR
jgi:hypothetical protein